MNAREPKTTKEKTLMKKENWDLASHVENYWHEESCRCDYCQKPIGGRHMIDGKQSGSFEFGLMCPSCHSSRGDGF